MKNIVLYTQRVEIVKEYNERRDCADQRIAVFINECGYLPVPIPNNIDVVEQLIKSTDFKGIILTGGNSLVKYGGDAPERDNIDEKLIEYSIDYKTPLYGFCRGMQSILDYYKCKLVTVDGHVAVRHVVSGDEGELEVNSYHNLACTSLLSDELTVELTSEDGVIEKVRHKELPMIGTMWHPEREYPYKESDVRMVKELFGGNE